MSARDLAEDPWLVRDLVRAVAAQTGAGARHGDGPALHQDTWEDVIRFVLEELEQLEVQSSRRGITHGRPGREAPVSAGSTQPVQSPQAREDAADQLRVEDTPESCAAPGDRAVTEGRGAPSSHNRGG